VEKLQGGLLLIASSSISSFSNIPNNTKDVTMPAFSIEEMITRYKESLSKYEDYDASGFLLGLCYIKLQENELAFSTFDKSLQFMLKQRAIWKMTAQPDWLVNVWILSGRKDLFNAVLKSYYDFRLEVEPLMANSLLSLYTQIVIELFVPDGNDCSILIDILTKNPKIKDMFAIGWAIKGILLGDTALYQLSLLDLLNAHARKAKFGMLRWTSEGYICMSACSQANL
jgi:hypothetical protein